MYSFYCFSARYHRIGFLLQLYFSLGPFFQLYREEWKSFLVNNEDSFFGLLLLSVATRGSSSFFFFLVPFSLVIFVYSIHLHLFNFSGRISHNVIFKNVSQIVMKWIVLM